MLKFDQKIVFQVHEIAEIHRDPTGHYHHLSILIGHLIEGVLEMGDLLLVQGTQAPPYSVRIGGFSAFRQDFGDRVCANDHKEVLGIMINSPALRAQKNVALTLHKIDHETYQKNILRVLKHDPSIFFHTRGPDTELNCPECPRVLKQTNQPTMINVLKALQKQFKGTHMEKNICNFLDNTV